MDMMTIYSIDDGHGNQLTAGLQGYNAARKAAQQRANDLGETVYLYASEDDCEHPGLDASGACTECGERCSLAAEQDGVCMDTGCPLHAAGEEHEPEAVDPETVRCACGAWSGHRCSWVGPESGTVLVEYMPEQHRASHAAAGNRGIYPHNGARRIRVERSCADQMIEHDGEWCSIIDQGLCAIAG